MNAPLLVITRPQAAAQQFAAAARDAGVQPLVFPALEITPLPPSAAAVEVLQRLPQYDLAIFISQNAVEHGLRLVQQHGGWPAKLPAAAIGPMTAAALRVSVPIVLADERGFDTESLLQHSALGAVAGKQVVIFRGLGGREQLREALLKRRASVDYVECYQRRCPDTDPTELMQAWARHRVDAVSVLSVETLDNFSQLIGAEGRAHLQRTAVLLPNERVARHARATGIVDAVVTGIGDEAILRAVRNLAPARRASVS